MLFNLFGLIQTVIKPSLTYIFECDRSLCLWSNLIYYWNPRSFETNRQLYVSSDFMFLLSSGPPAGCTAVRGADACLAIGLRKSPSVPAEGSRTYRRKWSDELRKSEHVSNRGKENMALYVKTARLCRLAGRKVGSLSCSESRAVSLLARRCYVATSTANGKRTYFV